MKAKVTHFAKRAALMVAVLLPMLAAQKAGASNYWVWIAGTQVTDANIDKLSEIEGVTGTITFDSSTFTLTLTDATITGAGSMEGALRCTYPSAMTVVVNGTCVINGGDNYGIYSTCGTSASTGLTVTGSGVLEVKGSSGIYLNNQYSKLTVQGPTVVAEGTAAGGHGICGRDHLERTSGNNVYYGILDVQSGRVRAKGAGGSIAELSALTLGTYEKIVSPMDAVFSEDYHWVEKSGVLVTDWVDIQLSDVPDGVIAVNAANFPDARFRGYLLSRAEGADGVLTEVEKYALRKIECSNMGIKSLKGIELLSLDTLICNHNELTELDLTGQNGLLFLDCAYNKLKKLDVSMMKAVPTGSQVSMYKPKGGKIYCNDNELTSLKISDKASDVYCFHNRITDAYIDAFLSDLPIQTTYDNTNYTDSEKSSGYCRANIRFLAPWIEGEEWNSRNISDEMWQYLWDVKKIHIQFYAMGRLDNIYELHGESTNWSYFGYFPNLNNYVPINEENFPDENFRNFVRENYRMTGGYAWNFDKGYDRYIYTVDYDWGLDMLLCTSGRDHRVENTTSLDLSAMNIKDLKGIEHFYNLKTLTCTQNQLRSLDVSALKNLTAIFCYGNEIQGSQVELPNVSNGIIVAIAPDVEGEKNRITSLDVARFGEHGWTTRYLKGTTYYSTEEGYYTGSTPLPPAGVSFARDEVSLDMSDSFEGQVASNPHNMALEYRSSNPSVATVDAKTGRVTLEGKGMTTISASWLSDGKYEAGSVSYTITRGTGAERIELLRKLFLENLGISSDIVAAAIQAVKNFQYDSSKSYDENCAQLKDYVTKMVTAVALQNGVKLTGGLRGDVNEDNQVGIGDIIDITNIMAGQDK